MKSFAVILVSLLTGVLLCSACGKAPGDASLVYRGELKSAEDGDILVAQLPGHNYGQQSRRFHLSDKLRSSLGDTLAPGAFVEVL